MRKAALIGSLVALLTAASVAYAAVAGGASRPSLARATARTAHVATQHYAVDVRITKDNVPLTLHIHGAKAPHTIDVRVKMSNITLPDGSVMPGPSGAELLDGPFLYERAPSTVLVVGAVHWLRLPVSSLSPSSGALRSLHDMTPAPLLRILAESRSRPTGARVFGGPVAYDDPIVRNALTGLTGGIEFHHLRITAWLGRDGLVHHVLLRGVTADGRNTLRLNAWFFGFGQPVSVTPPAQGTFLDRKQAYLSE